jgi:DNA-binding MarR family transcriptional regulator
MTDGGPDLFRLVRFYSRRWTRAEVPRHVQHVQVLEAVAALDGDATVSAVAHQLGLDHSGASRMVRDAAAAGLLDRAESDQDRRRTVIRVTEPGRELVASARIWQRQVFDELTAAWDDRDKAQFAGYLRRLAGDLGA